MLQDFFCFRPNSAYPPNIRAGFLVFRMMSCPHTNSMKTGLTRILFFFLFFGATFHSGQAQPYSFGSGKVTFTIRNAGLTVEGSFANVWASLKFDPDHPLETTLEGRVEVSSIETGIELRNRHLKKAAYFDAAKYPFIEMKLLNMEGEASGLTGTFVLTMKGVAKKVVLPVRFSRQGASGVLSTQFVLNRLDFGVGDKSWTMADQVNVSVSFQLKTTE